MRNNIKLIAIVSTFILMIAVVPAISDMPVWDPADHNYPRTVWSDLGKKGSVVGRVTTAVNGSQGIGNAYIAVVDASNVSHEYYNTTSDQDGNYQITGLNATYSWNLHQGPDGTEGSYNMGNAMYKMYANKSPYGEGYSAAFGIDADLSAPTTTSIVIFTKPARIELVASKPGIMADGNDNLTITATMYDALGNPVADGYNINFTVGSATNNAFMQKGFIWTPQYGCLLRGHGFRDVNDQYTQGNAGQTSIPFGWAEASRVVNSSTIWAYSAEDPGVFSSITVRIDQNDGSNVSSDEVLWTGTYGGSCNPGNSVVPTTDGGFIVSGNIIGHEGGRDTWNMYLIKTDRNGTQQWARPYGDSGYDITGSVVQADDEGYVLVGSTESYGNGSYDVYLIKTDTDGNVQWARTYGGTKSDLGYSIQKTSDGGYIIVGGTNSFSSNGYYDVYLLKTDGNGLLQWSRTFGGDGDDQCYSVQQVADGGYIMVGYTGGQAYLIKTDAGGNLQWSKTYEGSSDSVLQVDDGGYIIASDGGLDYSTGNIVLIKTDGYGNVLWKKQYGGPDIDEAETVRRTADGGYIIAGHTLSCGNGSWDIYLVKTDSAGTFEWNVTFGGPNTDFGFDARQTPDGGYIVLGTSDGGICLIRTDANYFITERDKLTLDYYYEADGSNGSINVNVSRLFGSNESVSVNYLTVDDSAQAGIDYIPVEGTLSFAASETSKTVVIPLLNDNSTGNASISGLEEGAPLSFYLSIGDPTNGTIWPCDRSPIILIAGNKEMATWNYSLVKGWNMISLPLTLSNDSVEAFFPDHVKANVSDMWYYDNGAWVYYSGTLGYSTKYAHLTNVTPGRGYWVKLLNNASFTVTGEMTDSLPAVSKGWTMFGVNGLGSFNATSAYPGCKDMWYYDNGQWYYYSDTLGYSPKYPHLNSLEPGKGYWVHY